MTCWHGLCSRPGTRRRGGWVWCDEHHEDQQRRIAAETRRPTTKGEQIGLFATTTVREHEEVTK